MGFNYSYTCPIVDKNIKDAKETIESFLLDLIEELSPMIPQEKIEELAKDYAENLYSDLEDNFEKVRESNSDMRKEADRQIEDLEDKIQALQSEIEANEDRIQYLEDKYT